jgi:membrane-associated PAP2 superfamily phosphatase
MEWIKKNAIWLLPVILVALVTPWSAVIDMKVSQWTFAHYWGVKETIPPHNILHRVLDIIYNYGCMPAQILCGGAGLFLLLSLKYDRFVSLRGPCLVLVLSLVLGSGIIAHSILKEWWGRPRPKQLVDFGGSQIFRPYYKPATTKPIEPSKSFPSGHSTTGFYFFAFYFIGKRLNNRAITIGGLVAGFALGGILSIARVMQGGHFVSDIVLAALIMWVSAYVSDLLVYRYSHLWKRDYAHPTSKGCS